MVHGTYLSTSYDYIFMARVVKYCLQGHKYIYLIVGAKKQAKKGGGLSMFGPELAGPKNRILCLSLASPNHECLI